jgi:hypothetical protein
MLNKLQFSETSGITHPRTQHHIPEVLNLQHYSKVKFNLKMPLRSEGRVEVKLYSFFNFGARCEVVINAMPLTLYPRDRDPTPTVQ